MNAMTKNAFLFGYLVQWPYWALLVKSNLMVQARLKYLYEQLEIEKLLRDFLINEVERESSLIRPLLRRSEQHVSFDPKQSLTGRVPNWDKRNPIICIEWRIILTYKPLSYYDDRKSDIASSEDTGIIVLLNSTGLRINHRFLLLPTPQNIRISLHRAQNNPLVWVQQYRCEIRSGKLRNSKEPNDWD